VPDNAEPGYLSPNGGTHVRVLVRTPGES
jgi:hypothetical protein